MTWEILLVLLLIASGLTLFLTEKVSADITAISIFAVLLLLGVAFPHSSLPAPGVLYSVFNNTAPITIAAMFVLSAAMERSGLIDDLARLVHRLARLSYPLLVFFLTFIVGGMSAFVNNTPVVVVLLPVFMSLSRETGIPASKLLIPLSFASVMGGLCTLVGTSTNILSSGILARSGEPPLRMFELTWIGLPGLVLGALYLALLGHRLLPRRETLSQILSPEERREYITEAFVTPQSPLAGKTLAEAGFTPRRGFRALEIVRGGVALSENLKDVLLAPGDRLILACRPHGAAAARSLEGINFLGEVGPGIEQIAAGEGAVVEGILGPTSDLIGRSISEVNFRQRYRMVLIAVHRRGHNLREHLEQLRFQVGDTILLLGTDQAIDFLHKGDDILLLDQPRVRAAAPPVQKLLVLAAVSAVILLSSLEWVPIDVGALLAVAFLLLAGVLKAKEAYQAIDWSILILIYSMLGLGLAMEKSGAAAFLASPLAHLAFSPLLLLAGLYLITLLLTEVLSNNATVALMIPIALQTAASLGLDPRPFAIAVTIAASAAFATPIGYQTNTYVYGVGGYKFTDFARIGLGLNAIYFFLCLFVIPLLWPLQLR